MGAATAVTMSWWMWFLLGLVLLLAEFITPGAFYLFFFGLGAIAVGLLGALGFEPPLTVELLLFLTFSLGLLLLLRKRLRLRFDSKLPDREVDNVVGEVAIALEDIPVDAVGKAELRGSVWNARNVGDSPIRRSQRCAVMRVDGLTLWIAAN
jgi:membrane protein implicated in regulation of membrane protease activity